MASVNAADIAIDRADSLMACDIAQLKELFVHCAENVEALANLRAELRYRQSPQALDLLNQIRVSLAARVPRLSSGKSGGEAGSSMR
jgi:hypothetical protein